MFSPATRNRYTTRACSEAGLHGESGPFRVSAGSRYTDGNVRTMTTERISERGRPLQSHSDRRVEAPREGDDQPLASTALHWALARRQADGDPVVEALRSPGAQHVESQSQVCTTRRHTWRAVVAHSISRRACSSPSNTISFPTITTATRFTARRIEATRRFTSRAECTRSSAAAFSRRSRSSRPLSTTNACSLNDVGSMASRSCRHSVNSKAAAWSMAGTWRCREKICSARKRVALRDVAQCCGRTRAARGGNQGTRRR